MKNQNPSTKIDSKNELIPDEPSSLGKKDTKIQDKPNLASEQKPDIVKTPKKAVKPPKIEDKPFDEFIVNHFIPSLKLSIEEKGTLVSVIKLLEGERPVVGGVCWMVFCELSEQRKFWLCFNKASITSDKTILLAESNSDPSIVESFLIDEKKTTLPLLISRVLQRLNGQKWIGFN